MAGGCHGRQGLFTGVVTLKRPPAAWSPVVLSRLLCGMDVRPASQAVLGPGEMGSEQSLGGAGCCMRWAGGALLTSQHAEGPGRKERWVAPTCAWGAS